MIKPFQNQRIPIISLAVIGDSQTGKTSMIEQYIKKLSNRPILTIAPECRIISIDTANIHFKVKIWDVSGQKRFDYLSMNIIENSQGIIIIYDITNKESFINMNKWIHKIKYYHDMNEIPIIIAGNKIDLEVNRAVTNEDISQLVNRYEKTKYYECSVINGKEINEIFTSIIIRIYNHKYHDKIKENENETYDIVLNDEIKLSNISVNSNISFNLFQSQVNLHTEYLSALELSNLISKLQKEEEIKNTYNIIKEIQSFLERMKPTKCDINYQKLFSLLFRSIQSLKDEKIKQQLKVNIFCLLYYIFPEKYEYFHNQEKYKEIIHYIHSECNIEKKHKYYQLYTNNYLTFEHQSCRDLIKIYNFYFCQYLNTTKQFFLFSTIFSNLIIVLYGKLKGRTNLLQRIGATDESPYIITVVESFGDIFIFIVVKSLLFNSIIKPDDTINIIVKLFSFFFEMIFKFPTLNSDFTFKIMCVYCLFFSHYEKENENPVKSIILEHILGDCYTNSKICIELLLEILLTINQTGKENNTIIRKMKNKLYLPYFNIVLDNELTADERQKLLNKSFLNDYDFYMDKVIDTLLLYKGCLLLLTQLYHSNVEVDDDKYPSVVILKEIYSFLQKEKEVKKMYYYIGSEVIAFISVIVEKKQLSQVEWIIIMKILYDSVVYNRFDNYYLQIINCFINFYSYLKRNRTIINIIKQMMKYLKYRNKDCNEYLNNVFLILLNENKMV